MMIDAGIEEELRQKLWAEAANMAADLDNILVTNKIIRIHMNFL